MYDLSLTPSTRSYASGGAPLAYTPGMGPASALVKFEWRQVSACTPSSDDTAELRAACTLLDGHGLLAAYGPGSPVLGSNGNLSQRLDDNGAFVVTATQLPSKSALQSDDFATVDGYDFGTTAGSRGLAYYHGSKLPSSESIMHWYFYRSMPEITAVVHVHESTHLLYAPESRAGWDDLDMIETPRVADAGTTDLPESIDEVLRDFTQYVVLKGHHPEWDVAHTGTLALGKTLDEAVERVACAHQRLAELAGR